MIKCIIVEDDTIHSKKLRQLLNEVGERVEVLAVCDTVDKAFAAINQFHPELVFLDVELGVQTGFDLLNKIDILELKEALKKFHERNIDKMDHIQVKTLKSNLRTERIDDKIIMVEFENALYPIDINDIIFLFSDNNYVSFVIQPNSKQKHKELFQSKIRKHYVTTGNVKHKELIELSQKRTLTEWENDLANFQFCRIYERYLINMNCVVKLMKPTHEIEKKKVGAGGTVILIHDITLPVSKSGREKFLKFRA